MSLLFNMLSRFATVFLPRSKRLLISWLQSPSAVILESKKTVSHCFSCFPIYLPLSDGAKYHDLYFLNVEFQASFFTLLFHFHQDFSLSSSLSSVPPCFLHEGGVICISEVINISPSNFDSSLCFTQPNILHDVLCI